MIAMGDDQTDEDMFAAVGDQGLTVHVGSGTSRAQVRVESVRAARAFLELLLKDSSPSGLHREEAQRR